MDGMIPGPDLITRDGGPLRASATLRDKVAIFSDGRCLVSPAHARDLDVLSVIALARRLGIETRPPEFVDLGSLRGVYGGTGGAEAKAARDDTMMQREVQDLLRRAAQARASDIHLLIDGDAASVRIRVDGELRPLDGGGHGRQLSWRADHGRQVCMTAYAMAAEGGTADASYDPFGFQAGRMMTGLPEGVQAVRLQFNPVGFSGRHLVMRLLYAAQAVGRTLTDLGFSDDQASQLEAFTDVPAGLVVVSGPTGSGKTTTLERLMRRIVETHPGDAVLSVEDPPEYLIPGVVQLPVANLHNDEDRDDAYQEAIAAALRSDPDRIMIGEVRTRATARHAFEAAMTGHPVLTTVHANDALGIVPRLLDIGVEPFKLRDPSLVIGLVAQRLVRRLCPECRRPAGAADLPAGMATRLGPAIVERPFWLPGPGCPRCRLGYRGRTVVAELIRPDHALLDLLVEGKRHRALDYWLSTLGGKPFSHQVARAIAQGTLDPIQAESQFGRLSGS
jgi:type II secretory ATPase GspE/PulE/Tfp pilus assembly ATPase PilB-like protein